MKVDLSTADVFEDNELDLDKKITFIFGKNGTGKSTIAKEIKKLNSDYEVSIFQGFDNVIDENHRLNAVVLGEENLAINAQIEQKKKELEQKQNEIDKVNETLEKPESQGISNFWTRRYQAQEAHRVTQKKIDDFYTQSAAEIKRMNNPQIAKTSYNRNSFKDELQFAALLQDDELNELKETVKSEVKVAPGIVFPSENMEQILIETNEILRRVVTERVKVKRIDNNPEKREFAKVGLAIHRRGEVCAFCGNSINFDYFSKKAEVDTLLREKEQREKEFENQKNLIDGPEGLKACMHAIMSEITDLQNQTKNESILAENINKKLLHMVSFKLDHFEDSESKGFYRVKDCNTNVTRDITELSTGEKNIIAFLYFLEKLNEVKEVPVNKPRIIVFDDPMNSNDDGMQYLIMEELQNLMQSLSGEDHFILLTHNKHFYINIRFHHYYNKDKFIRLQSNGVKTQIIPVEKEEDDFKTSYEALWMELKLLYEYDITSANMLLNPIRRIIETFTKFNALNKTTFCSKVVGAKKLFDVNSHSIDDLEAELNGKTKQEIMQMLYDCFKENEYGNHFLKYWKIKSDSVDENGKLAL